MTIIFSAMIVAFILGKRKNVSNIKTFCEKIDFFMRVYKCKIIVFLFRGYSTIIPKMIMQHWFSLVFFSMNIMFVDSKCPPSTRISTMEKITFIP